MNYKLLSNLRALDLTNEIGFVCGKILAMLGVDVIKVEKPGGDTSRLIPPFASNEIHPEKSLYWSAFNTDKRSITLDLASAQGQKLFHKLAFKADFILESYTPGYLDKLNLGYESIRQINPKVIMASITPFGQTGPYAQYKGCELIASAMSGIMLTNGDPDRPPLREGPDSIYFESNAAAALGTVIAYYHRQRSGEGQHVDVSLQEVAAKRTQANWIVWEFDKILIPRSGPTRKLGARSTLNIWRCKDGYLFWNFMGGPLGAQANRALSKWMDDEGFKNPLKTVNNWEQFDIASMTQRDLDKLQDIIAEFFMNYTKKEVNDEGLKRGLNACVVETSQTILQSQQLKQRAFWTEIEHPELNMNLSYPKQFFVCSQAENFVRHKAPSIGQHNAEIYINELGMSSEEISILKEQEVI